MSLLRFRRNPKSRDSDGSAEGFHEQPEFSLRTLIRMRTLFISIVMVVEVLAQSTQDAAASIGEERKGAGVSNPTLSAREESRFSWPSPFKRRGLSEASLSNSASVLEGHGFQVEIGTDLYRISHDDPIADFRDALMSGPELLVDTALALLGGLSGRSFLRIWADGEGRSVTDRLGDIRMAPRQQSLFAEFIRQWIRGEQRYFGEFDESRASKTGFWGRTWGADLDELAIDQRRVFWDALRRTYLSRYLLQSEEEVREGLWSPGRWRDKDFVVLPPLIGAYVYFFGVQKKISMGDMAVRISIEPVTAFLHPKERSMATGLEWTLKGLPVGIIVSAGFHDGRYGLEFVGIGTSLGIVRRAVDLQYRDPRP